SVNVSVLQLEHEKFYEEVMSILCRTGLDPKYLQLEITETFFTQNYQSIVLTVKKLSRLGIMIAIDDFGTGYSSLGQLCEININNIKIDRMFIDGVDRNNNKSKIVKAVISLAESLNINLTAEGVETKDQLAFLKENRCTIAQGFLFSKPVEKEEIKKLFKKVI
ncbi:MAG: EAL domain-containing protein, partial [Tissierellia bacterium]|nr:EAL domain-containing protein [Tissierellia bacterium]